MTRTRIISALIVLSIFASNANAHWEDHDVRGKYLFGYSGASSDLNLSEIEGNLMVGCGLAIQSPMTINCN
jgi:hypothetical protein